MIGYLKGTLQEKQPPRIVIDIHGIGYEVDVSMQTFYVLPNIGESIHLFTQLIVREDAHLLFGFATQSEREIFRQLLKVSGIGAKIALGILSALSSDELIQAIAQEDSKKLSSIPGIGKKTAERMILELRGKLSDSSQISSLFTEQNTSHHTHQDIIDTLIALGYSEREAKTATKSLAADIEVGEGVRLALKNMLP